jgi:hypothetical protein
MGCVLLHVLVALCWFVSSGMFVLVTKHFIIIIKLPDQAIASYIKCRKSGLKHVK